MTVYYTKLKVAGTNFHYYGCYYKRNSSNFIDVFSCIDNPQKPHKHEEYLKEKLSEMITFLSPYKLTVEPTETYREIVSREIYK
jgi:hypothetical protein